MLWLLSKGLPLCLFWHWTKRFLNVCVLLILFANGWYCTKIDNIDRFVVSGLINQYFLLVTKLVVLPWISCSLFRSSKRYDVSIAVINSERTYLQTNGRTEYFLCRRCCGYWRKDYCTTNFDNGRRASYSKIDIINWFLSNGSSIFVTSSECCLKVHKFVCFPSQTGSTDQNSIISIDIDWARLASYPKRQVWLLIPLSTGFCVCSSGLLSAVLDGGFVVVDCFVVLCKSVVIEQYRLRFRLVNRYCLLLWIWRNSMRSIDNKWSIDISCICDSRKIDQTHRKWLANQYFFPLWL